VVAGEPLTLALVVDLVASLERRERLVEDLGSLLGQQLVD
jgi:hypothetical protein